MSKDLFTPGPWSYRVFDPDGPLDDAIHSTSGQAGDGDIVCLSPEHGGFDESALRWKDNARLISAAPELLEALELYVAVCGNTAARVSRESASELYDIAAAVIAKARGDA